jgi:hypothetical protein
MLNRDGRFELALLACVVLAAAGAFTGQWWLIAAVYVAAIGWAFAGIVRLAVADRRERVVERRWTDELCEDCGGYHDLAFLCEPGAARHRAQAMQDKEDRWDWGPDAYRHRGEEG